MILNAVYEKTETTAINNAFDIMDKIDRIDQDIKSLLSNTQKKLLIGAGIFLIIAAVVSLSLACGVALPLMLAGTAPGAIKLLFALGALMPTLAFIGSAYLTVPFFQNKTRKENIQKGIEEIKPHNFLEIQKKFEEEKQEYLKSSNQTKMKTKRFEHLSTVTNTTFDRLKGYDLK